MTEKVPPLLGTEPLDPGDPIVGIASCNGEVFLATSRRVYALVDGVWRPMVFELVQDDPPGEHRRP